MAALDFAVENLVATKCRMLKVRDGTPSIVHSVV